MPKEKEKIFPELDHHQHEFLRKSILKIFHVETEDTADFYFFTTGEITEFKFGAFIMRRTSELQIIVESQFKEFAEVFSDKGITVREASFAINLPDITDIP